MLEAAKSFLALHADIYGGASGPDNLMREALCSLARGGAGCAKNSDEIIEGLVIIGGVRIFDINLSWQDDGWNVLVEASYHNNYKMVGKLIQLGANPFQLLPSYFQQHSVFHRIISSSDIVNYNHDVVINDLIDIFVSKGIKVDGSQFTLPSGKQCPSPLSVAKHPKVKKHLRSLGATE